MMNQFRVQYRPGGMGLSHSSWWIAETRVVDGMIVDIHLKFLKWADYR
jgi:hypothetical protein